MTLESRFWAKVDRRGAGECWPWLAAAVPLGYGVFWRDGALARAPRVAYELLVGPIPEGMELDHLCRNPPCVNPAHLEPVTHRENMLRSISQVAANAAKTECDQGHPFTPENTYVAPATGKRGCRTCRKAWRRSHRERTGN